MRAEADAAHRQAIQRYIHRALSATDGGPTGDTNPLVRRNERLSSSNPLL